MWDWKLEIGARCRCLEVWLGYKLGIDGWMEVFLVFLLEEKEERERWMGFRGLLFLFWFWVGVRLVV